MVDDISAAAAQTCAQFEASDSKREGCCRRTCRSRTLARTTMHSSTLSIDFSFRSTLAFMPFQPLLSRRAPSLYDNSCILKSLRTLFLSLRSFSGSRRVLFSKACALFCKNTRGGYPSSSALLRSTAKLPALCFHTLSNCFFRNSPVFTTIRIARGVTPARRILGGPNPSLQGVLA